MEELVGGQKPRSSIISHEQERAREEGDKGDVRRGADCQRSDGEGWVCQGPLRGRRSEEMDPVQNTSSLWGVGSTS